MYAKAVVAGASAINPPTIKRLRPIRSESRPAGSSTTSREITNALKPNPNALADWSRRVLIEVSKVTIMESELAMTVVANASTYAARPPPLPVSPSSRSGSGGAGFDSSTTKYTTQNAATTNAAPAEKVVANP